MKEKEERTNTFSKSIMSIMMFLYFMGAALGAILVILAAVINVRNGDPIDTQMFIAYAAYVGGPTATAIGFYAWKSKAENLLKIQQSHEVIETLSQMGGN
jgi:hypothetical protein